METVYADDGTPLPLDGLFQTLTRDGTLVSAISVQYPSVITRELTTYTQFITYDGTLATSISNWQAQ